MYKNIYTSACVCALAARDAAIVDRTVFFNIFHPRTYYIFFFLFFLFFFFFLFRGDGPRLRRVSHARDEGNPSRCRPALPNNTTINRAETPGPKQIYQYALRLYCARRGPTAISARSRPETGRDT